MRGALTALLIAVLLSMPLASAAEAEGAFTVRGPVTASEGVTLEGAPLALFMGDTGEVASFEAKAALVKVTRYERRVQELGPLGDLGGFLEESSWMVQDATIGLLQGGDHAGFCGIYPSADSRVSIEPSTASKSEPRALSRIGNANAQSANSAERSQYFQTVSRGHIYAATEGAFTHTGKASLKVAGLDIEIRAGNVTRHETGERRTGPAEYVESWVVLDFLSEATIALAGAQGVEAAFPSLALAGEGSLGFVPLSGDLRTSEGTYAGSGSRADVEGTFRASLVPHGRGQEGTASLSMSGDVRPSSSFVRQPAPSALGAESPSWWGVALVLGAVATMGVGVVVVRRTRKRGVVSPVPREERMWVPAPLGGLVRAQRRMRLRRLLSSPRSPLLEVTDRALATYFEAIEAAEVAHDTQTAYDLTHAARRALETLTQKPQTRQDPLLLGDLLVQEGEYLLKLEQPKRAYTPFQRGAALLRPLAPERAAVADYGAAVALARHGGRAGMVVRHLEAALEADPDLVGEAEVEAAFARFAANLAFRAAMDRAKAEQRRRHGAGDVVGL